MDLVKKLIAAGATIPGAIKEVLSQRDLTVTGFADKHELPRSSTANHINGSVRASEETVAALVAELGGTEGEWRDLLWQASRPFPARLSA